MYTITTVFPSVTGPAYTPFLMGKHPGSVGLPGLRWYDRTHAVGSWPSYARSYVGFEMQYVDSDLDRESTTMFELAPSSIGALSVIQRGLSKERQIARGARFIARTAMTHFRGDVQGWLQIDREIGDQVVQTIRDCRPAFTFAAFTGPDKMSHAAGHEAPVVLESLQTIDDVAARIRHDAERGGYWDSMHLWIVSDHGHSPVTTHEDLAGLLSSLGFRVLAHPLIWVRSPQVAVMVSGNAMAHLYLELEHRARPFWPALEERWDALMTTILGRQSVDLMILPMSEQSCIIRTADRGVALLEWKNSVRSRIATYTYRPITGDPLQLGTLVNISEAEAYDATITSDYPDSLVQLAHLCASPRSGDVILSAARGWDFRAKYEPIVHVSAHGALHREHMLTPMVTNRPVNRSPRRTVDVMASAAYALGTRVGEIEGESFL
jgi:hypothetical protein